MHSWGIETPKSGGFGGGGFAILTKFISCCPRLGREVGGVEQAGTEGPERRDGRLACCSVQGALLGEYSPPADEEIR